MGAFEGATLTRGVAAGRGAAHWSTLQSITVGASAAPTEAFENPTLTTAVAVRGGAFRCSRRRLCAAGLRAVAGMPKKVTVATSPAH